MSTTTINLQNSIPALKIQFKADTGQEVTNQNWPLFLEYAKAVFADRLQQTLGIIHNDLTKIIKNMPPTT